MHADYNLATLLRYENIAWYEDGAVRILDRRVYPARTEYVICRTYGEVARAVTDMITQSYGPFHAAAMGMVLAAHECREQPAAAQRAYLSHAADVIATARPTTTRKMRTWTDDCERDAAAALDAGESACEAILSGALHKFDARYEKLAQLGRNMASLIPDNATIMTQCYADADLGMTLRALNESGKTARFFSPETRPYLQGARLTASVILEMGFDVTLITDNMPAYTLQHKNVDIFTTAADVITLDGHVVNKVGTFQIALSANDCGVPYYVTGTPDKTNPTADTIEIEERDPNEVLYAMGVRTCMEGVHAYYPAFDITPPRLVKGVVTYKGIFAPDALDQYVAMPD